jgi:inorganic pyrophosphatase
MQGATLGDGDPLDVCVVSERPITRADILLTARVIGGLPMLDAREADDKIIAVLERDPVYGEVRDVTELPQKLIDRLVHYFETYKWTPSDEHAVEIGRPYDRAHAHRVIEAALEDYLDEFAALGP